MADSNSTKQTAVDPALPEKKKGRRRLIGAAVFLTGAAVLFSLVFDHEPKPPTPELALKIPPREATMPASTAPAAVKPEAAKTETPTVEPAKVEPPKAEPPKVEPPKAEPAKAEPAKAEVAKAEPVKAKPKKPDAKPTAEEDPFAKLTSPKPLATGQTGFMVQIGAFSSNEKLDAAIASAKEAGFKVLTEKIKTTNGQRTRVRVGPFPDKDAANSAREKLKSRGLEPAVIAL